MGLAGTKTKQRFGSDPRNTAWSNNTERFGRRYLESQGWAPGKGLGMVEHATTSHVKVSIKTDNTGLGALLAKKQKKDEFDSGECAGLDVFQRILGRLNGKEQQISDELERRRIDNIINGKWGIHFVKGEVLQSTWDKSKRTTKTVEETSGESSGESKKRRLETEKETEKSEKSEKKLKKQKKEEKKEKKEKKEKEKKDKKEKKEKEKKEKKDKDKKDKKEKTKKDKKEKTEKSEKKDKKNKEEITRDSMLKPLESEKTVADRLSARAKWIRQKRASVMDAKALNEIFMVSK